MAFLFCLLAQLSSHANLSPESEDRNDPSALSEFREENGAAKASGDAVKAAADEAKAADAAQMTASDAKSAVPEDVPGVVDSESMKKDLRCIKYELKKLKSREISEVVSRVDPFVLQELRDEIAAESHGSRFNFSDRPHFVR
jgi:hypothetical protein